MAGIGARIAFEQATHARCHVGALIKHKTLGVGLSIVPCCQGGSDIAEYSLHGAIGELLTARLEERRALHIGRIHTRSGSGEVEFGAHQGASEHLGRGATNYDTRIWKHDKRLIFKD